MAIFADCEGLAALADLKSRKGNRQGRQERQGKDRKALARESREWTRMKFNHSYSSFAQIRVIRGQLSPHFLGALGVLGGSNRTTLRSLAKVVVAMAPAPALRFVGFDYIEFDGWADSMGKRNFAPSPRAAMALGESRP